MLKAYCLCICIALRVVEGHWCFGVSELRSVPSLCHPAEQKQGAQGLRFLRLPA